MELKLWSPVFDIDKDWRFEFPRWLSEGTFEFRPSVDVVRHEGELVITAELPGMTVEDVDVTLEEDVLTIKGEKTEEKKIDEEDHYVHERTYGKFSRRIAMPSGVSADKIAADFDKGILTIKVTLPEEKKLEPHTIPVKTI